MAQETVKSQVQRVFRARGASSDGKEGVVEGLVRSCVAEEIGKMLEAKGTKGTPKFIGLDEFSVRKKRLYHTAICDLVNGEVMEVVEGQGKQKVEEYLDRLPEPEKVKAVAMDMHESFRQLVQLPHNSWVLSKSSSIALASLS